MHSSRTIAHVDMDMFFVAVELRQRPDLIGKPVVVGGDGRRGVVAAASYEARRFGVFSAMPSSRARRLCPDAIFLPGDMSLYSEVSALVFGIFRDYTPLVEGLSLDEAFLDITGALKLFGDAVSIAESIRSRVHDEVGLVCSVGIGPSKFIAKLASKQAKPIADQQGVRPGKGVVEVRLGEEISFVHPLPVKSLWGVGPATLEKLERIGIRKVSDLAAADRVALQHSIGEAHANHLINLAHGIDHSMVVSDREAKSIGNEETFSHDLFDRDQLRTHLVRLADEVARRCRNEQQLPRTITLKVKFSDFQTVTRSHTSPSSIVSAQAMLQVLDPLLESLDLSRGVRLIGIGTRNFDEHEPQLSLFDDGALTADASTLDEVWAPATRAIDDIRERFGDSAIRPASTLRSGKRPAAVRI
jgi:DNA polymerase-4